MTRIVKIDPGNPDKEILCQAVRLLWQGKLIGYPTETVYGLGASAFDPEAVKKLYHLKRRPLNKPVILLISGEEMLLKLVTEVPPEASWLIRKYWPGPLTIVFRAKPTLPPYLQPTIALRVSSHPVAHGLVATLGTPLISTSANLSGALPACSAQQVQENFPQGLELILDSGSAEKPEVSTVVDVTTSKISILREGKIKAEEILQVLKSGPLRR